MIQPSALNFVIVSCFIIIFGMLWRAAAAKWSERPIGQAMATIF